MIFVGGREGSEVERMVNKGREAVALDTIEKAMAIPTIDRVVVATNSHRLARRLRHMPVLIEFDVEGEEFHFGHRLRQLIEKYCIERPFYMGGGSGALLSTAEMEGIVEGYEEKVKERHEMPTTLIELIKNAIKPKRK